MFFTTAFMLIVLVITSITPIFAYSDYDNGGHWGGWLVISNRSGATDAPMVDSHFAIFRTFDEQLMAIVATDWQGRTEAISLPPGEYFIEQQFSQHGYDLLPRQNFAIVEGMITEKSVFNHPLILTIPLLTVANNPVTVAPIGQTPSAYTQAGSAVSLTPGYAENWRFIGWTMDGLTRYADSSLFFTMPDFDITVTALWEAVEIPAPMPEPTGRLLVTKRAQGTNEPLQGAVFEVRRHIDDYLIINLTTDHFGEATVDLPVGDYFILEVVAPSGFVLNTARIPVRITAGTVTPVNVTNVPLPASTPTPETENNEHGRLIVTKRAHGTNELLPGAVFEIRRAMDSSFVAEMVTNQFGEATINLPPGDYFLREIIAPYGFTLNPERRTVRITAGRITEINITNAPLPAPELPPPPIESGRLVITKRDADTNRTLEGAVFEVRRSRDDFLMGHLATNNFGEAAIDLMPDDYYLREIIPPHGFVINTDRRNFTITEGQVLSLVIHNSAVYVPQVAENGRLLVTVLSGSTGQRIPGAVVSLHNIMNDIQISEMTADNFGEASEFLPPGSYFVRQRELPAGYAINFDRIPVTIRPGEMTDIMIVARPLPTPPPTPAPPSMSQIPPTPAIPPGEIVEVLDAFGRLEIVTRAEGSGNPLSGGLFSIYTAAGNRRIAELTTETNGTAYIELEPGQYFIRELRPTYGFLLEDMRILVDVAAGRATQVEMTKQRDTDIPYLDPETYGGGKIYIPQTGQDMSLFHYVGGGALLLISLIIGGIFLYFVIDARMRD